MREPVERPPWLCKKIDFRSCRRIENLVRGLRLHTVCREAFCPNISECFSQGVATFLVLGNLCTRRCLFCAVPFGRPEGVDEDEPARVAQAVRLLGLRHVVITSVTRDDLADGGAHIFAETVRLVRGPSPTIEVLVPDFRGDAESIKKVAASRPDIFAHNIETVPRLYKTARDRSSYGRSISVLEAARKIGDGVFIKSGIMLGLGEKEDEVFRVFHDLRKAGCDFLSIGQYLSPSPRHLPVHEYVPPARFAYYKERALDMGFLSVASGPYVRSSYMAHRYLGIGKEFCANVEAAGPAGAWLRSPLARGRY